MKLTMSEARYNDLVYLTLKKNLFEPMFGENASPRECDIRICMQLGCPELMKTAGLTAAILSPNEVSGRSHTKILDIDTDAVFETITVYMEEHWLKQELDVAFGRPNVRDEMLKFFNEGIIPAIQSVPEEECAITIEKPNG